MAQETNVTILGDTSVVRETQNPQEAEGSVQGESAAALLDAKAQKGDNLVK
jgi:hypothetical protein